VLDNNREGYVLIKGKSEKLIQALVEDRDTNIDQYYVEDFLLMYRTFIENPIDIFEKFLTWFNDEPHLREKVARLVLLWVNNHFNDFETEPRMTYLLEQFEQSLEQENMINHQQLLNIACSVKSRARVIVYTRSNRDEMLHFSILGGSATLSDPNSSHGIFISNVENNSQAQKNGLKRGDQILEVNNVSFLSISLKKALEILRGASLLSMTVKANVLGFKEMISGDNDNSGSGDNKLLLQSRRLLAPLSPNPMCSSESTSNIYLVPRTKSYGAQSGAVLKIPTASVPKQLHHAHSYVDGRQMPGLSTFANRGSVPGS
uniref:Uncharacterized protein n=1 Tax=Romanomermis culicivorax TaxID=13658 RepID=A0A915JFS8_ROMCU